MSAVEKVLVQGEMGYFRGRGHPVLGELRGFPEEAMAVEKFKLGNGHDQICKTY